MIKNSTFETIKIVELMNPFARFPFFRYVLPLICGITIEIYFNFPLLFSSLTALIFGLLITFYSYLKFLRSKYRLRFVFALSLQLFWLSLGLMLTSLNKNTVKPNYFENIKDKKYLIVKLKEPLSKKRKSWKALGEVTGVINGTETLAVSGNLLMYFLNDSSVSSRLYCGDEIIIEAKEQKVECPKNPGEFDFKRYLAYQSIEQQVFVTPGSWITLKEAENYEMLRMVYRTRDMLLGILNQYIDDKTERGVAGALLFGYKDELDSEVVDAYARTGTLHVLAVSGMHVAILYVVVSFLFKPFQKKKMGAWLVAFFTIFLIWFYSLISGMSPSIVRASVMFTIIVAGKVLRDDISIYNNLFTSACFILCYNPYFLFDAGFQLSYLAVLGIVYFQPKIASLLVFKSWLGRQCWGLITVSVAAQIATVPISLYYFNQFPNFFILSNLIIIPITTFIMYSGILLIVICKITPVAALLGYGINKLIAFADFLIIKIQSLPYAVTEQLYINKFETFLWYLLILLLSVYFANAKKAYLKSAFVLCCLLMINLGMKKVEQNEQHFAVLNAINNSFSLNIIDGKKNYLFCDSNASNTNQKLKMHFKSFWNRLGLETATIQNNHFKYTSESFIYNSRVLITQHSAVYFVDENTTSLPMPRQKINYLVLSGNCKITLETLLEHFDFECLVMDGSLKARRSNKYIETAQNLNVKYYNLLKEGALILQ